MAQTARIPFLKRIGLDGFILTLFGVIFLAWLWPQGSIARPGFSLSAIAAVGVSFTFFFYGLRLDHAKIKSGLSHWQLHIVVQAATFLVFPVIAIICRSLFYEYLPKDLWLGILFFACLPSTVSSSVVMVSIAKGNIVAAIFNASISSLIGVFLTPLWMSFFANTVSGAAGLGESFMKLIIQVLLPVIAGIILHQKLGAWAEKNKDRLKLFDQLIILLIVYTSFGDSFLHRRFDQLDLYTLVILVVFLIALFFFVYFLINLQCRLLKFNRPDTIAAAFCGSKKSLVHGTVMSKVLFTGAPFLGMILLPLMIYHAAQLLIVSVMARRLAASDA